jgi:chemotaxis signal transduction protein
VSANGERRSERAAALRREFDGAFARAALLGERDSVELLAVRVCADAHAIRLTDISGLYADRRITPVPGPLPELLGVVGLRGSVVPVYDLRLLLGHTPAAPPRWLVLAAAGEVGLAFDQLDGHVVAPRESIVTDPEAPPGESARELVDLPGIGRCVLLRVPSLVEEIAVRVRRTRPAKER